EALADIDDSSFDATQIESAFQGLLDKFELKLGKLAQPVRVALTGTSVSPGIFETIEAMGKDMTIDRLTEAISYMKALPPSAE
ncbi:MAG: glutamate--tRNA ligase, partial [Deltaproteobacteria bacterium]|nr:glutamate--tRNA ligase [Deltaproteobacteria bacterium]